MAPSAVSAEVKPAAETFWRVVSWTEILKSRRVRKVEAIARTNIGMPMQMSFLERLLNVD